MSYLPSGQTELISRKGYGGLGADTVAPGVPWGYKNGKCVDTRSGKEVSMDACTAYAPAPKVDEGFLKKFAGGVVSFLTPKKPVTGAAAMPGAPAPSGAPGWVAPLALGVGALTLVMVLKKK